MSVSFARAIVAGLRSYGVTVLEEPGWETRGNGQASNYQGAIIHHTAASGVSRQRPEPSRAIVINGRRDLSGPLCNMLGLYTGPIRLIAAHPANHAGASGGRSMGPLPTTTLFNRLVWGLEIDYDGVSPMSPEQYRTAVIFGAVVTRVLGRPSAAWIRAHAETSITGKYDPGYAPGKTIDMALFRRNVWAALNQTGDDDMTPEQAKQLASIHHEVTQRLPSRSAYAKPPWSDTVLGTALNAEGRAHEALIELRALVAALPRVVRDEVRAALAEERKT